MAEADLVAIGWTAEWAAAFEPHRARGLLPGRVSLEHNHVFRVATAEGEQLAETAGRLKHRASGRDQLPAVGDWVGLRPDASGGRWVIASVLPRRTSFSRKAAGRGTGEQIIAANIDLVFVVVGLDAPVNRRRLERYLALARQRGVRPVVVLNKIDIAADLDSARRDAVEAAGEATVLLVAARTGAGLDDLRHLVGSGVTAALLGPSGAGKSSIVNGLVGDDVLATGEVRAWDTRGRHTSVHRQLIALVDGGALIDTPGLRELQLWDGEAGVAETFADIEALAGACRFRDCLHDREPGCAVKAAVDAQALDRGRYDNFLKLGRERSAHERQLDERAQLDAKDPRPRSTRS